MTVKVLQPTELKNYWPEIKNGLEKVLQKTQSASWIPEEIFSAVYYQKAICVIGLSNEDIAWGFVGYTTQDRIFFVWAAWSHINTSQGFQALDNLAKRLNCTKIKFETDRLGWEKLAPSKGFRPCAWIKEL